MATCKLVEYGLQLSFPCPLLSLCRVGCLDANGDFPFTVPSDLPTGDSYKIRYVFANLTGMPGIQATCYSSPRKYAKEPYMMRFPAHVFIFDILTISMCRALAEWVFTTVIFTTALRHSLSLKTFLFRQSR